MKENEIMLVAHPENAPGCVLLAGHNGKSALIQTDWDFPSVASSFGFSLRSVQKCDICGAITGDHHNVVVKYCRECEKNVGHICAHSGTDGTVDCACGVTASRFIFEARRFIDDNDGKVCENPGYTLE